MTATGKAGLTRIRPEPIPALHPVWEFQVSGERRDRYAEVKRALQVPWVGVLALAYAHYEAFFAELWRGLKPLAETRAYVEQARALRAMIETEVETLSPPPIRERLFDLGYSERELDEILAVIDVLSHGNHLYVIMSVIARMLMEEGEMAGGGEAEPFQGRHAPEAPPPLILLEPHHADAPTRAVYEDVKATLHLPFVNTDYRAFARWPSYFALAWNDLRAVVGGGDHEGLCLRIHDRVAGAVASGLPNPGGFTSAALRAAAERDASIDEVIQVCRLFQWLLPGLVTNVAYFRCQLMP